MTNIGIEDFSQLDSINQEATGRRIKFLVQQEGFSQSQLAIILDRDSKTISNYYRGKSLPEKKDLIILSTILGKSYDEILVFKGDVEGYQRVGKYLVDYSENYGETKNDALKRSKRESKLFNPYSKGHSNIRNLKEAGYCLEYLSPLLQQDIKNRMMDEMFTGRGVHSIYMHHILEVYIWRMLSEEQKAESKAQFDYWRGEKKHY